MLTRVCEAIACWVPAPGRSTTCSITGIPEAVASPPGGTAIEEAEIATPVAARQSRSRRSGTADPRPIRANSRDRETSRKAAAISASNASAAISTTYPASATPSHLAISTMASV